MQFLKRRAETGYCLLLLIYPLPRPPGGARVHEHVQKQKQKAVHVLLTSRHSNLLWFCEDSCSGGLGQIDHEHLEKLEPKVGQLVVKIGGPAYRIGMGGGAASSVPSGSNRSDLDFNAVQVCGNFPFST